MSKELKSSEVEDVVEEVKDVETKNEKRSKILKKLGKISARIIASICTVFLLYCEVCLIYYVRLRVAYNNIGKACAEFTAEDVYNVYDFDIDNCTDDDIDNLLKRAGEDMWLADMGLNDVVKQYFDDMETSYGSKVFEMTDIISPYDYIRDAYDNVREVYKDANGKNYINIVWITDRAVEYIYKLDIAACLMLSDAAVNSLYDQAIEGTTYDVAEKGLYQTSVVELRDDYKTVIGSTEILGKLDAISDKIYRLVEFGYNQIIDDFNTNKGTIEGAVLDQLTQEERVALIMPSSTNHLYSVYYINRTSKQEDTDKLSELSTKASELEKKLSSLCAFLPFIDEETLAKSTQKAMKSAFENNLPALEGAELTYVTKALDRDYWTWSYFNDGGLDSNGLQMIYSTSLLLNKDLLVVPEVADMDEEFKRDAWVMAERTFFETAMEKAQLYAAEEESEFNTFIMLATALYNHLSVVGLKL